MSRVVQGVLTGIGFLGAGTILKGGEEGHVTGLTTAASLWLAGAVGVAIGSGRLWIPGAGVALALVVMALLRRGADPHSRRGHETLGDGDA